MNDTIPWNHLERIRHHLWSRKEYGNVALMVGAGFSRNAERRSPNIPPFPLWQDLGKKMYEELYPGKKAEQENKAEWSNAIKMASQYEANFDRTELDMLLRKLVQDENYLPGKLHKMLLRLPWADIFTTNYDTLLERTLPFIYERKYDIIRRTESVPGSRKPRIIKLHGSLPDTLPFIVTEEDYRRYPIDFSPFVTMVQQSLLENIFCLIGFSGDDPNFLNWTGWIRDNLGKNAPKIHLIGILDIPEQEKKLYEQRGITPIDLTPCFPKENYQNEDERKAKALEWFMRNVEQKNQFDSLSWPNLKQATVLHEQPSEDLPPIPDSVSTKVYKKTYLNPPVYENVEKKKELIGKDLQGILEKWKLEREYYPGWNVLPFKSREKLQLWTQGSIIHFIITNIDELSWPENLYLMFELNWRLEKALIPQYSECIQVMIKILESHDPIKNNSKKNKGNFSLISECWVNIAFAVLRSAREDFGEDTFHYWKEKIYAVCNYKTEWRIRLYYETCMFALYHLDFAEVRHLLDEWPESGENLHWEIKKIGILTEIGDLKTALALAEKLLHEVRLKQSGKKNDYYLLSLEGWLLYNLQILYTNNSNWEKQEKYRDRLEQLNLYKCNPWTEIEIFELKLKSQEPILKESEETSMGFDPYRYQTTYHGNVDYLNYKSILPAFNFLRLLEEGGLPLNCPGVRLYSGTHINAARWIFYYSTPRSISVLIRSLEKKAIDSFFSRTLIISMDSEKIEKLFPILTNAWKQIITNIQTGSSQGITTHFNSEFSNFEILSEVLSRFCIRLSKPQIEELFNLMVEILKSSFIQRNNNVYQAVAIFLKRLLSTMTNQEILQRFSILLSLPLPAKDFGIRIPQYWPDPLDNLDFSKYMNELPEDFDRSTWKKPIDRLLRIFNDGKPLARQFAFGRLRIINKIQGFTPEERKRFSAALWSKVDNKGFPADTGFMVTSNFVFLDYNEKGKIRALLKTYLLNLKITVINKYPAVEIIDFLESIKRGTKPLIPMEGEKFDYIKWSEDEAVLIFQKISELWNKNRATLKEENETIPTFVQHFKRNLRGNLQKIPQILAEVIIPICQNKKDKKFVKEVEALLHEMEQYGIPVKSAKPGLMFFDREISGRIAGEIKQGIESLEPGVINESIDGLCNWMIYRNLDHSFPDVPPELIEELISILSLRRQPGLWHAIDYTSFIIKNIPEGFSERQLENISSAIDYLIDETDPRTIKKKDHSQVNIPIKIDEIPHYRNLVSNLAYFLYNYLKNKQKNESQRMKKWKETFANDILPEVRKTWNP